MTFGSLFSGIGGLDLGLERAGLECKWQVEIDDYCQQVLTKHWPDVGRWDDVRTFPPPPAEDWTVDVIAGGFPCQDISCAGNRTGIDGDRSGLWREFARIVRDLRPQYVVVENVPALLVRGMDRVLGDLAASGFDAEWRVLSAKEFGAHHLRKRLFIVANAHSEPIHVKRGWFCRSGRESAVFVDGDGAVRCVAHTKSQRRQGGAGGSVCQTTGQEQGLSSGESAPQRGYWAAEPDVGRVADGVSARVDRLAGLGNAVVPQVAEWIGKRIVIHNQHKILCPPVGANLD